MSKLLPALMLGLMLALTSVISAAMMAPDRDALALARYHEAHGGTGHGAGHGAAHGADHGLDHGSDHGALTLCGTDARQAAQGAATAPEGHGAANHDTAGHDGHEHHCPFCHSLPQAPDLGIDRPEMRLFADDGWREIRARHRAAQARRFDNVPRAPPAPVQPLIRT